CHLDLTLNLKSLAEVALTAASRAVLGPQYFPGAVLIFAIASPPLYFGLGGASTKIKSSTLFWPTGACPANVPSLTLRTLGGEPWMLKSSSPVGSGFPSMLMVPLTSAVGGGPGRPEQPKVQTSAKAQPIARPNRYIGRTPAGR